MGRFRCTSTFSFQEMVPPLERSSQKTLAFAKEVSARVTLLSVLQPFHVEAEAVIRARLERAFKERIRRLEQQHAERIDQLNRSTASVQRKLKALLHPDVGLVP